MVVRYDLFLSEMRVLPVSASTTTNYGNGVAMSSNLSGDGTDNGTNQASKDIVRSSRSGLVDGSAALDGTAVAAAVDDWFGHRGGGEGSGNEESNFGEHRK